MDDRQFWLIVRRALLMVCKAIEKKYCIGNSEDVKSECEHTPVAG